MNITERAVARQIVNALTPDAPKAVTDSWRQTTRLSQAAGSLGSTPDALYAAVLAALDDDHDPAADPEVQRLLAVGAIANPGVTQAVDNLAYGRFRDVCREHADAIVASWATPFDKAATTLVNAHKDIGDLSLEDDSRAILAKGGNAAAAWTQAWNAVRAIDAIIHGWVALATSTRLASTDPRYVALRITAPTLEQWQNEQLERRRISPWESVQAGISLDLPTFGQYHERIRIIESAAAKQAADRADDQLAYTTGRRPLTRAIG